MGGPNRADLLGLLKAAWKAANHNILPGVPGVQGGYLGSGLDAAASDAGGLVGHLTGSPLAGQLTQAGIGLASPGPARASGLVGGANELGAARNMGRAMGREAYVRSGAGYAKLAQEAKPTLMPSIKGTQTAGEMIEAAGKGLIPPSQVEKYRRLLSETIKPGDLAKMSDRAVMESVDALDLWPRAHLNEVPAAKLKELVDQGYITKAHYDELTAIDPVTGQFKVGGTVNKDRSWQNAMKGKGAAYKARKMGESMGGK